MRLFRSLPQLFLIAFTALFSSVGAQPELLKKTDIRTTLEEMFSYHVEYKELNPTLVKRSFKSYIEQFDFQKMYLLQSEVKPYLELTTQEIELCIDKYATDEYPLYEQLQQTISKAIQRSCQIRNEIMQELITKGETAQDRIKPPDYYYQYPVSEDQLRERIRATVVYYLLAEKKSDADSFWTKERREKILGLVEKRFARFENNYGGKGAKGEHDFSMHFLKAMSRSLDAHTGYFTPQEAFEMRTSLEKQFEGIGVVLKEGVEGVEVSDLIKGGPAQKCGHIQPGDFLIEIDGRSVATASYEEVLEELKGEGQKKVSLGLKRFDKEGHEQIVHVELQREKILMEEERVTFTLEPFGDGFIGKMVLPSFYESSAAPSCEMDMREALKAMKQKGKLRGLVVDMRENLGGFLSQAVRVAGLFITSGVVVISKYAHDEIQYMRHVDPRLYYNGPLVLLTSKMSASAAEIVAQALQDYGVAVIVGDERTYGKGTIQYQTVTDMSASAFFKVTVGRYYTVSGRSTQIEGVQADVVVPTAFAPYNIGERYLEYPLHNDRVPSVYNDTLADVDGPTKMWFQKNYLPYVQKKESCWYQMLPTLKTNSAARLKNDPNFKLFLEESRKGGNPFDQENKYGVEDLQMTEAVSVVKDMIMIQAKPKP